MKSPKLLCSITLFLLFQLTAVEAQIVTTPRLTYTLGDGPTITVCESDTVTFTATGDSGPTPLQASFSINRRGTIIYPYGPSPQPITTFAINWLEDGDIVSARVWTFDNGGGNALNNSIGFGMGIAVENFDFGIQFNALIRKINQVYAPSVFELYFAFDFSPFRRNNRGVYKRLQIDNY